MSLETSMFPMVDGIVTLVLGLILFRAYRRGIFSQIYNMISIVCSFGLTIWFYKPLGQWLLAENFNIIQPKGFRWVVIVYVITRILFVLVGKTILKRKKKGILSMVDRLIGLCLGLVEVYFVLTFRLFLCGLPVIENGNAYRQQSFYSHVPTMVRTMKENVNGSK